MGCALLDSVPWLLEVPIAWFQIAATVTWLGIVVSVAIGLERRGKVGAEIVRKVIHIGAGNVILLAWWLQIPAWIGIGASVLLSVVTLLSYRFPILPGIDSVGRKSLGTFFYAVSIGMLVALFWQKHPFYAVIGVLIMTWGDGFAAIVGQRWGKHPYRLWEMQKSWEGSLTMAVVSYGVTCLVLLGVQGNVWQTWVVPVGVAVVATGLEAFSRLGIDNLTVPLGSAAIAFLLNQIKFPLV